jgi:hypothetical protein
VSKKLWPLARFRDCIGHGLRAVNASPPGRKSDSSRTEPPGLKRSESKICDRTARHPPPQRHHLDPPWGRQVEHVDLGVGLVRLVRGRRPPDPPPEGQVGPDPPRDRHAQLVVPRVGPSGVAGEVGGGPSGVSSGLRPVGPKLSGPLTVRSRLWSSAWEPLHISSLIATDMDARVLAPRHVDGSADRSRPPPACLLRKACNERGELGRQRIRTAPTCLGAGTRPRGVREVRTLPVGGWPAAATKETEIPPMRFPI